MIDKSEIQETIKDLIIQYGLPSDTNSKLYLSIIKSTLVSSPFEEKIFEQSIHDKIPLRLSENKGNSIIINQIIQEFSIKNQIDVQSAQWVTMTWANAIGLDNIRFNKEAFSSKKCPNCHKELSNDVEFCQYCGASTKVIQPQEIKKISNICPNCHKELSNDVEFCQYCGSSTKVIQPPEIKKIASKKCPNCQKELSNDVEFCQYCGSSTKVIQPPEIKSIASKKCPNCHKELSNDVEFCQYCGSSTKVIQPLEIKKITNKCPNCHKELSNDVEFCQYCGTKNESYNTWNNNTPLMTILKGGYRYAEEALMGRWERWGILCFACLIFPISFGYGLKILKGVNPAPEIGDIFENFINGLKVCLIGIPYAVILCVIFFLLEMLSVAAAAISVVLLIPGFLFSIIFTIFGFYFAELGVVRYARTESYREAFNILALYRIVRRIGIKKYFYSNLILLAIGIIFCIIFVGIPVIGWLIEMILAPLFLLMLGKFFSDIYDLGK